MPTGTIKMRMSIEEFLNGWRETCVLDMADRGGMTLEEVGEQMGFTRERSRQVETLAIKRIKKSGVDLSDVLEMADDRLFARGQYE